MDKIDFSQTGGFPLTQDRLAYMQDAYVQAITALANGGNSAITGVNIPVAIAGMVQDNTANTISDGWLMYNGEFIAFTGGSMAVTSGNNMYIVITTNTSSLAYYDGTTKQVLISKSAALQLQTTGTTTDATKCLLSTLIYQGATNAYTPITGTATDGTSTWSNELQYRYDPYKKVLHIKGNVTFTTFPATGNDVYSVTVATMVSNYGIGGTGFTAYVNPPQNGSLSADGNYNDPAGNATITSIDGYIGLNGEIVLQLKPSPGAAPDRGESVYNIGINIKIPTD